MPGNRRGVYADVEFCIDHLHGTFSSAGTAPLVLTDGLSGNLDDVDPNDIQNISFLKDAASASIYGNRAANGVILIETKSGTEGKPVVNYNGWIGWSSPTVDIEYMNSYQYASTYDKAQEMAGVPASQRLYSAEDLEMYFFKQKTAYAITYGDWSSDVCSSDLTHP